MKNNTNYYYCIRNDSTHYMPTTCQANQLSSPWIIESSFYIVLSLIFCPFFIDLTYLLLVAGFADCSLMTVGFIFVAVIPKWEISFLADRPLLSFSYLNRRC